MCIAFVWCLDETAPNRLVNLVSDWWDCLESIWTCGLVGGDVSLSWALRFQKPTLVPVSSLCCVNILLPCHACLPAAVTLTIMTVDSHPLELRAPVGDFFYKVPRM